MTELKSPIANESTSSTSQEQSESKSRSLSTSTQPEPQVVLQTACPLCQCRSIKPLRSERNRFGPGMSPLVTAFDQTWIQLMECEDCGFGFTKELPTKQFFKERYDIHFNPADEAENHFKDDILDLLFDLLVDCGLQEDQRDLLDIGSFAGIFLRKAKSRGFRAKGIELNPKMAEYTRDHLELDVHSGEFLEIPLEAQSFDVITLIDVLEHLVTPKKVLDKAIQLLKPGGFLLIKVPNMRPQIVKQEIANRLGVNDLGVFENFGHINHFSPRSLENVFGLLGLETRLISASPSERLEGIGVKTRARNELRRMVYLATETLRKSTGLNLGLNINAIAQKPRH